MRLARAGADASSRPRRPRRPRWRRRKAARPEELVVAALEVFVERGYAAARLEDVARRAGVTKGTIYLYFENKEALFKAMVRQTIVPTIARAEQEVAAHRGSAAALVRQLVLGWWDVIGKPPLSGLPKLMMAEAATFPELARFYHDEVISRGQRLLRGVLERGIQSAEFRRVDVQPAVRLALAPVLHAANWQHSFALCRCGAFDIPRYLNQHLDIFLRGIAGAPGRD